MRKTMVANLKLCFLVSLVLFLWCGSTNGFGIQKATAKNGVAAARRSSSLASPPPPARRKKGGLFQSAIPLEGDSINALNQEQQLQESKLIVRGGSDDVTKTTPMDSIKNLYRSYLRAIEERPILTKGLTAAVVNLLGDLLAQFLEASTAGAAFVPNWVRVQGFFLCGLVYAGPYVHAWYEQLWKLGRWMEEKYNSPKQIQTIAQLVVDQTLGVLLFFSTYFYVYEIIDALVNHRLPIMSAATAKITDNLGSVLITNYYFWPIINWISFSFVPAELRVLLNNVVGVLWNAFLCTKMAGGV